MTRLYNHLNVHGLYEAEDVFLLSVQPGCGIAPLLHNPLNLLSFRGYNECPRAYITLTTDEVKFKQTNEKINLVFIFLKDWLKCEML